MLMSVKPNQVATVRSNDGKEALRVATLLSVRLKGATRRESDTCEEADARNGARNYSRCRDGGHCR